MATTRLLLVSLLLGACAGDDAAPSPLVGSWRAIPSAFDPDPPTVAERQTYTFDPDGTLHHTEGQLTLTSSYQVTGDQVTMNDAGIIDTGTFDVDADLLLLTVMTRADGPGPVGTWRQTRTIDGKVRDLALVLRADQSAHVTGHTDGSPTFDDEATWARTDDDLDVTLVSAPGTVGFRGRLRGDRLGTPYERL